MRRNEDVAVNKLRVWVSNGTLIEEKRRFYKRFYKDDRVRLRGSVTRRKGTVMRAAIRDEGGLIIKWDHYPQKLTLHNPRYIETVWVNDKGEEE